MDVIAVKDYPRTQYSAYWEISIDRGTFEWTARIISWDAGRQMVMQSAVADSMADARLASQTWVKSQMERFKRS